MLRFVHLQFLKVIINVQYEVPEKVWKIIFAALKIPRFSKYPPWTLFSRRKDPTFKNIPELTKYFMYQFDL